MKKIITLAFIAMLGCSATTFAQSARIDHPRRAEVNARLRNQDKRINKEKREGEITGAQANRLHRKDHQIRREEHIMAANNHGHITKAEKRSLNQQENHVSRKIGH